MKVKDLLAFLLVNKAESEDMEGDIIVTQTTPLAPTLLTATDLLTGDKIRLVWTGTGPFYNVYYKVTPAGPYILANGFPLGGASTQYDVGGLDVNVNYTFKIVIPKTEKEDISWMAQEIPDAPLVVYEVDNPHAEHKIPKNKGREAMVCDWRAARFWEK